MLCYIILISFTNNAWGRVPPEIAAQLGTTLTPMGANPEGNSGTIGAADHIPPYTGAILGIPSWVNYQGSGFFYPTPYPNEQPVARITASNFRNFDGKLSDGLIALLQTYPDTFFMPIYPSKRDTRYSDFVHNNAYQNALSTELAPSGGGVNNIFGAVPFPIPNNGEELAFNNQYAPNTFATKGEVSIVTTFASGGQSIQTRLEDRYFAIFDPAIKRSDYSGLAANVMIVVTSPAREKGKVILVHEYSNSGENPRNAWQYLPGNRRVRRAPTIAYDYPDGPGGLRTVDDALIFNGTTDRFTWKIEGIRELYIPYNNNELDNPQHKYDELLPLHHVNPNMMRYELHRCWVIVGELRPGKRHLYSKRRIYLDEDSWAGLLADNYDLSGQLIRTSMRSLVNLYDMPGMGPRLEIYHDLPKRAYQVNNLINEGKGPPKTVGKIWSKNYFTPANLRKLGRR